MATVIDQFIVKYTLDTKDLDKGLNATEKKLDKLKKDSAEAGSALSDSIGAGAKRATGSLDAFGSMLGKGGLVGVALGSLIYAAKAVDDKLFTVARSLRRLGIDSKNFGIAANEMRNLQNASELAGGSMEDATHDVASLSKSLFNLKFNGQVSESLVMLSRLGVQFQDSYGRARNFNDVMLDTANAIERAKKAGRMTDAEGYQFALQSGFSGGDANLVNSGVANLKGEMAKQQARRQVQGKDVAGGTRWERGSQSLGQGAVAGIGNAAIGAGYGNDHGAIDETLEVTGGNFKDAAEMFGDGVLNFLNAISGKSTIDQARALINKGKSDIGASGLIDRSNSGAAPYMNSIKMASLRYNIPEEVIIGMMRTESTFNPKARSDKGASGLMQLMPETRKVLGVPEGNNDADINAAVGYLDYLRNHGLKKGLDPMSALVYGVDAYHAGEGSIARHENIGPKSMSYAGSVLQGTAFQNTPRPWMGDGGSSTSVQIDNITINTQATDANGIAGNIADSTKRKFMTAQAERGTQ